jgi:ubiquinone/menaquinone biosynthesis C-methylase UbiE
MVRDQGLLRPDGGHLAEGAAEAEAGAFEAVAPYYDLLMSAVPYDVWTDYYRLLLSQMGSRPATLLDVCCGTGTVAERMARAGCLVTGIDRSPRMIDVALARAEATGLPMRFVVADVTAFDLAQTFEGAFSFFDSLNYVTDAAGLTRALARVAAHLESGASLVFDLNTAYAFEKRMFDQQESRRSAPVRYVWKGEYDPATRIIRVSMRFETDDGAFQETHFQRAHSDDEVRQALSDAGFVDVRSYDSYTLNPPRKRSDRVHYTAVKS